MSNTTMTAAEFETALATWLAAKNAIAAAVVGTFAGYTFSTDGAGRAFVRIVRADSCGGRSAYCFVERATGLIFKPAGWKGPARNFSRGSITEPATSALIGF